MNGSKLSSQFLQWDGLKIIIFSMSSQGKWKSLAKMGLYVVFQVFLTWHCYLSICTYLSSLCCQ